VNATAVMNWDEEEFWLRHRVIRLRTILRLAKDARVAKGLREFITRRRDPQSKLL
jgi:hypothetical protein